MATAVLLGGAVVSQFHWAKEIEEGGWCLGRGCELRRVIHVRLTCDMVLELPVEPAASRFSRSIAAYARRRGIVPPHRHFHAGASVTSGYSSMNAVIAASASAAALAALSPVEPGF